MFSLQDMRLYLEMQDCWRMEIKDFENYIVKLIDDQNTHSRQTVCMHTQLQ
jgi:hypothetical protein